MSLVLALTAAILVGQTEAPPPSTAGSSTFAAPSPHVGQGHFTLGTSGNFSYLTGATTFSILNAYAGVSGGYFVHDRILVGANLSLNVTTFFGTVPAGTSTTSVGLGVGGYGQYWHPLGERFYLFAGASVSVSPAFGTITSIGWSVTPRVGLSIFLTDWLALQPSLFTTFSEAGAGGFQATVGIGWGMAYFI